MSDLSPTTAPNTQKTTGTVQRVRRPKIEISLTHHQLAAVQAMASPLKLATFAKCVLMAHVEGKEVVLPKTPPKYPEVNQATVAKLGAFLNSIANNINQLTRYCHEQRAVHREELHQLIQLVQTLDVGLHKVLLTPLPDTEAEAESDMAMTSQSDNELTSVSGVKAATKEVTLKPEDKRTQKSDNELTSAPNGEASLNRASTTKEMT